MYKYGYYFISSECCCYCDISLVVLSFIAGNNNNYNHNYNNVN